MALGLNPSEKSAGITFGIYKPASGYDIDDALRHIRAAIASAEQAGSVRATILSSLNGSWVAVFCDWRGAAPSLHDLSQEATAVLRKVDCGSFHLILSEPREVASSARLSVGGIVSVRRIYTDIKTQEVLAYSCVAVSRAYSAQIKGLLSSNFYKSEDGMLIIGLDTWDNADSASALLDSCGGSPGDAYWRDLAKKLKYEVCRVVYITRDTVVA